MAQQSAPSSQNSTWTYDNASGGGATTRDPYYQTSYQPHPQQYNNTATTSNVGEMQATRKRSASSVTEDDGGQLPSKKPRKISNAEPSSRPPNSSGSKRGYNSKKRSETAQMVANTVNMAASPVSYTPNSKGKASSVNAVECTAEQGDKMAKLTPELQSARCMSSKYKNEPFPRCVSCTRRWAGDTCRFQNIRLFLKDKDKNVVGISFVNHQREERPNMKFPEEWNENLGWQEIKTTKEVTAKTLLPVLRREQNHVQASDIIYRPRESEVRATCDTCMTSLFCSTWMCRLCGREACAECYEKVRELTHQYPGMSAQEKAEQQQKREKHTHGNPFFMTCTKRNEHTASDFTPVSRFSKKELDEAIEGMSAVIGEISLSTSGGEGSSTMETSAPLPPLVSDSLSAQDTNPRSSPTQSLPPSSSKYISQLKDAVALPTTASEPETSTEEAPYYATTPTGSQDIIPSYLINRYFRGSLTLDVFQHHWTTGLPLLVEDVLKGFEKEWTPEYFVEKYGTQPCIIVECQSETNKRVTVGEFFKNFGKYEREEGVWKLKDWPPSTDFKSTFPELYEDFSNAVPVPKYVRRDGTLNIASHFPRNTVSPDLGPKMYNAMRSREDPGSKGSTRLHMDMADALNIMTYASNAPDGSEGCAAWDLFRSEDSEKLRGFLKRKFPGQFQHDPIHSQQVYLDRELRRELFNDLGVKSFRVYQRPGEAIFIPAGVAHQVCNLADCIKVAIDFVSPENVMRCERLTKEFREQNQSKAWKEDVLQLRSMMWFAWLSCCRQEESLQLKQREQT